MAYGRRYRRRRMPAKTKRRGGRSVSAKQVANIAKKVLIKTAETKVSETASENNQLYHNTLFKTENNPLYTTQGTTDGDSQGVAQNRVGDMVQGQKLWWRVMLFNKEDRPNLHYRMLVVRQQTDRDSNYHPSLPADFKLEALSGNGNLLFASSSQERATVVVDKTVVLNSPNGWVDGLDNHKEVSKIVNINYKIPKAHSKIYYNDGGSVPKKYIYNLYIVPYDAYGTLTTDNIASFAYSRRFYYKDV